LKVCIVKRRKNEKKSHKTWYFWSSFHWEWV
jgi:hypothetical protein